MSDTREKRYSVCIAHEWASNKVNFYRVADYYPADAEKGNELIPALCRSAFDEPEDKLANPDYIFCGEAYSRFYSRDSDVYMLEWNVNPLDHSKQDARVCNDANGMPVSDNIREVVTIPGVTCRSDLVETLQRGYGLGWLTTREFYLVYECPADSQIRRAIKCKRDDFVSRNGTLRLLQDPMNVRQSILTAPMVELPEEGIIQSEFDGLKGREIYAGLGDSVPTLGNLLLRPIAYYAADYVRHYLDHCQTVAKLADKERRYAVVRAIDEALSCPKEIEAYLGAECPQDEIACLKDAISRQLEGQEDDAIQLVKNALMDDDTIRGRLTTLARAQSEELLASERSELEAIENQRAEAEKARDACREEVASLKDQAEGLKQEVEAAQVRISGLANAEQKAIQELEDNVALRIGLGAMLKAKPGEAQGKSSPGIFHAAANHIQCADSDGDMQAVLEKNLRGLGVVSSSGDVTADVRRVAAGVVGGISTGMPLAIPEPLATPVARALAAARFSSTPSRIVVPADYRDIATVMDAMHEPGVYLVEGVIDAANEGVLFALQRQRKDVIVIFSFKSHASAFLLAREAWDGMFALCVGSLSWAEFLARPKALSTMREATELKAPSRSETTDISGKLAQDQDLSKLNLPYSSFVLPAAVAATLEEMDGIDYELAIAEHLAMAAGATSEALQALDAWCLRTAADSTWARDFRLRAGVANE